VGKDLVAYGCFNELLDVPVTWSNEFFLFFDVDAVSDLLKYDGSELILGNFVVDVTAYSRP